MSPSPTPAERYLSLLKKSLLDELYLENEARIAQLIGHFVLTGKPVPMSELIREQVAIRDTWTYQELLKTRARGNFIEMLVTGKDGKQEPYFQGRNLTFLAHTMIGRARLDNIHHCLDSIVADKVAGDLIETGVWRGGATIFMRGYLATHRIRNRKVWVADSFEGLPKASVAQDNGYDFTRQTFPYLAVSLEDVQELFARYELLDAQVQFLKGWFKDTLPVAPIKKLALLRLDGDLYESTMDALTHLYPKLESGGYIIVDDYWGFPPCAEAVEDYRKQQRIKTKMIRIDDQSLYWRKK